MKRKITENCILTKPVYEENENKNIAANVTIEMINRNDHPNDEMKKTVMENKMKVQNT